MDDELIHSITDAGGLFRSAFTNEADKVGGYQQSQPERADHGSGLSGSCHLPFTEEENGCCS